MAEKSEFKTICILEYLTLSGEATSDEICGFFDTPAYIKKLITKSKKEGLIKSASSENWSEVLRLTNEGKRKLTEKYPEKYSAYLSGSNGMNKVHSDTTRNERRKKLIVLLNIFGQSGVKVLPGEKHYLVKNSVISTADGTDENRLEFYTSSELKLLYPEYKCARGSRAFGILISRNMFYTIYYIDDADILWREDTERKFALRTGNDISRIINGKASDVSAVLFSNNQDAAVGFMKRMNTGTLKSICTSQEFSRVLFSHIIPTDKTFEFILNNENELNKLRAEFLRPEESNIKSLHADGMSKDGPYICAFDSDIKRIGNFITNCALNNRHSVIFCFDFQKGYIEDFIKECRNDMKNYNTEFSIKVVSKPVDEYRRRLFEQTGQENT